MKALGKDHEAVASSGGGKGLTDADVTEPAVNVPPSSFAESSTTRGRSHHSRMASGRRTRLNVGMLAAPAAETQICMILFIWALASPCCHGSMHITAFEYQKKFHAPLKLGDCPMREVAYNISGTLQYHTERCLIRQVGTVTHTRLAVNDSRIVRIEAASEIVNYIGLCGGEAASFLGILNHGDCIAVDIASTLKFTSKTLVQAYIAFYKESEDTLEPTEKVPEVHETYFQNKFYLKIRSYGTIEIIFVHFRFNTFKERALAASINLHGSALMSDYLKHIRNLVIPNKTTIISLSTSNDNTYSIQHFNLTQYNRAIRAVEIEERSIQERFEKINLKKTLPHLSYDFYPFLESDKTGLRSANPLTWEGTSMLEIQIRQALNQARKNVNLCKQNEDKQCNRARALLESLKAFHKEYHNGRANWVNLNIEDKNAFSSRYSSRVKTFMSLIETLTRDIKKMIKNAELAQMNLTRHASNEISKTSKKTINRLPPRPNRKKNVQLRKGQ